MDDTRELSGPTLHDTGRDRIDPDEAVLICVGSAEDHFRDAGRWFALAEFDRVAFGRTTNDRMQCGTRGRVLEVGIPLPWVSIRHAELALSRPVGGAVLHDQGSRNGISLAGRVVAREASVGLGAMFEIGRSFWVVERATRRMDEPVALDPIGSAHPGLRQMLVTLGKLAPSVVPLLLYGETGTGKSLLAERIHAAAGRPGDFVRVNVVSGGFVRRLASDGAGAVFEEARGGTLFLDEIGELSLSDQARLVSLLMAHTPPVGQRFEPLADDVRVIAASTRDLRNMVATEAFRPDLFALLAGYEARLPPLRERREDLGLLVRHLARRPDGTPVGVSTAVFRSMLGRRWPFNLRELQHTVGTAVALVDDERGITPEVWERAAWSDDELPSASRIEAVRQTLVAQLSEHGGDKAAVAASLGCSVVDIERWLDRFAMRPEAFAC